MKRYRRKRSANVFHYNPWNEEVNPGDLLVDYDGRLFRAEQSTGYYKRRLGELTPKRIKPPKNMKAVIIDNEVYWIEIA